MEEVPLEAAHELNSAGWKLKVAGESRSVSPELGDYGYDEGSAGGS
jgi:hypothetical protein